MAGDDWSREEVEATVGDYFSMLRDELAGLRVNKAEHNERLRRLLRSRSKGSVEFKHANISAVLTLHGYPYIGGYKPDSTSKRCSSRSSSSIWTCIEISSIH
jgi:hypothetical protein